MEYSEKGNAREESTRIRLRSQIEIETHPVLSSGFIKIFPQANAMSHPVDPVLLTMIRCPVTHSELAFADQDTLNRLNEKISRRELVNQLGQTVETELESGLMNEDSSLLLPIRDGIVVLIADQAIPLR